MTTEASDPPDEHDRTRASPPGDGSLEVLLLEDNPGDARLFAEHLEESPVEATLRHKETLEEGLSVLEEDRPDDLVLDLGLPDSEGTKTIRAATAAAPQVPIVVLTGEAGLQTAMQAQEAGATDYLRKAELTPALVGRTLLWAARHAEMESRLQHQEARLQRVADSLPGLIFRLTVSPDEVRDTAPTDAVHMDVLNRTDEQLLRLDADRGDVFGPFAERIPASHRDQFLESVGAAAREETALGIEVPFDAPGRERRWLRVSASPERRGGALAFSGVLLDVTDRRKRERRYEAIFNQTYQFIGLMEPDGTLIEANDTALRFGGLDRDDVIGKPFWDTYWWQIDEETQQRLREAIDRAAEGEFVRYDVEVQGGDETIIIDFSIRPITDEDGTVTLLIPEGRDISQLKALRRREREVEQARNLLAQAQRMANVGGWKIDVSGSRPYVPEWTDELYDIFELSPEKDPTLEEILEHFPPEAREERRAAVQRAIESGEGWDQESRMVTAEGQERWVRSIGTAVVEDGEVTALQGAFQDITERKQRERQLRRQNRRLDQFASLVSHDLRNPLNVAKGRLRLARESDAEDAGHLDAVDRSLDRMDAIIEDLLTLTWGRRALDSEEVEPCRLPEVADASWNHVNTAQATLQIDEETTLQADETRLRRLLENLFRNAVEHGGQGVTVTVGALPDGFYVEDDGPGIPAEKRDEVLQAGYSSEEEGTGLGLSIVGSIAEAHGWELVIAEGSNGGARFEFHQGEDAVG